MNQIEFHFQAQEQRLKKTSKLIEFVLNDDDSIPFRWQDQKNEGQMWSGWSLLRSKQPDQIGWFCDKYSDDDLYKIKFIEDMLMQSQKDWNLHGKNGPNYGS
jgi:hypothetical protein